MSPGSCIRCGMPPAPGSRYCAECEVARRGNGAAPREIAMPPVSEEYAAHTDGRIARLEDEVASLRRQLVALADRTAERLEAERLQALTLPELLAAIDSAVEGARRLCGDVEPPIAADGASEEVSR
jgi:hypothetical protein